MIVNKLFNLSKKQFKIRIKKKNQKKKKISKYGSGRNFRKVLNLRKLNMFKYTELKNVRNET